MISRRYSLESYADDYGQQRLVPDKGGDIMKADEVIEDIKELFSQIVDMQNEIEELYQMVGNLRDGRDE